MPKLDKQIDDYCDKEMNTIPAKITIAVLTIVVNVGLKIKELYDKIKK
jgi:hypothetical protein